MPNTIEERYGYERIVKLHSYLNRYKTTFTIARTTKTCLIGLIWYKYIAQSKREKIYKNIYTETHARDKTRER